MSFASVVGHAQAVALLQQAVMRDRVPQSLLFAGPEGVGKRTIAVALAQAVNCPEVRGAEVGGTEVLSSETGLLVPEAARAKAQARSGPKRRVSGENTSVPLCQTCLRIARGQHSDVVMIDRGDEASIKIQTIRERVLETVGYRPFEGRRRVYIIDGADDLRSEAQDALLKTLEEPPPAAILILVTARPDTLLPTIQSRCRRLRFGPLSEADVARVLVERCSMEAGQARVLAATSGGSVSHALDEEAGDVADDRDVALDLLTAAAQGRMVGPRLKAAAALAQHGSKRRDREALSSRLSMVASLLRDLVAIGSAQGAVLTHADLAERLSGLSRAFPVRRALAGFSAVDQARSALGRNASPKIVADWVALAI
jgi:DNA polymerase-3 subunit delta'